MREMTKERHDDMVRLLAAGMLGSMEAGTWDRSRVHEMYEVWDEFTVRKALALAETVGSCKVDGRMDLSLVMEAA